MIIELIIILVTLSGWVLAFTQSKYTITKISKTSQITVDLEKIDSALDDFVISETKERINQELGNLAADELKANVLAGTAVVVAVLLISEFLKIIGKINVNIFDFVLIFFFITTIMLVISFLCGLAVLIPRKNRFNLWLPRESNNSYKGKTAANLADIKTEYKKETIENFESIVKARETDANKIKSGYALLISGSISSFIILFLTNLLWISND